MQDQKLLTRTLSTVVYLVCCYILEFIDGKTQRSHRKSTNVVRMHESDELGIRRPHVTSSYHYVIYMMPSSFINWFLKQNSSHFCPIHIGVYEIYFSLEEIVLFWKKRLSLFFFYLLYERIVISLAWIKIIITFIY